MKPSAPALIGAVIVCGGWVSVSNVAFAGPAQASGEAVVITRRAVAARVGDDAGKCRADTHMHASGCTCAQCSGASVEQD